MRQRDRCLQRIADRVGQQPAAGEPAGWFQLACPQRMHEHQHAELLAFRPERMEARIGEFLAGDAAAHADAAEPSFFTAYSTCSAASSGCCRAAVANPANRSGLAAQVLRQCLVLHFDKLCRGVARRPIPVRIDAEHLDIDALRVHRRDPRAGVLHQQAGRLQRVIDQCSGRRDDAVGMHVDRLDALAVKHRFPPTWCRVR